LDPKTFFGEAMGDLANMKWILGAGLIFAAAVAAWADPRQPGPHPPSQALNNPEQATEQSLLQGAALYKRYCVTCHAIDGSGKTDLTETLDVPPASFQDEEWKYGASDGEIFTVIREGGQNGMQGFAGKMPEPRMWQIVNFLRTLSKQPEGDAPTAIGDVPENPIQSTSESAILHRVPRREREGRHGDARVPSHAPQRPLGRRLELRRAGRRPLPRDQGWHGV
jgi:mono/diheme cytochrome c family protein